MEKRKHLCCALSYKYCCCPGKTLYLQKINISWLKKNSSVFSLTAVHVEFIQWVLKEFHQTHAGACNPAAEGGKEL